MASVPLRSLLFPVRAVSELEVAKLSEMWLTWGWAMGLMTRQKRSFFFSCLKTTTTFKTHKGSLQMGCAWMKMLSRNGDHFDSSLKSLISSFATVSFSDPSKSFCQGWNVSIGSFGKKDLVKHVAYL